MLGLITPTLYTEYHAACLMAYFRYKLGSRNASPNSELQSFGSRRF